MFLYTNSQLSPSNYVVFWQLLFFTLKVSPGLWLLNQKSCLLLLFYILLPPASYVVFLTTLVVIGPSYYYKQGHLSLQYQQWANFCGISKAKQSATEGSLYCPCIIYLSVHLLDVAFCWHYMYRHSFKYSAKFFSIYIFLCRLTSIAAHRNHSARRLYNKIFLKSVKWNMDVSSFISKTSYLNTLPLMAIWTDRGDLVLVCTSK